MELLREYNLHQNYSSCHYFYNIYCAHGNRIDATKKNTYINMLTARATLDVSKN
jgi:hypothetical protein